MHSCSGGDSVYNLRYRLPFPPTSQYTLGHCLGGTLGVKEIRDKLSVKKIPDKLNVKEIRDTLSAKEIGDILGTGAKQIRDMPMLGRGGGQ